MIRLTRMNEEEIIMNCDVIEFIEEVPHTVVRTTSGNKYVVKETTDEIVDKIVAFKKKVYMGTHLKGK